VLLRTCFFFLNKENIEDLLRQHVHRATILPGRTSV